MKLGDVFPSKYLKAADIPVNTEVALVIDRVAMEDIGDDAAKPCLYFKDRQKAMVLNRTNFSAIEMGSGRDDTDDWGGLEVLLYRATVVFNGGVVPCLRLRMVPKATTSGGESDAEKVPF